MKKFCLLISLSVASFGRPANCAEPVSIGFLEYTNKSVDARVAFAKLNNEWRACEINCPSFPKSQAANQCNSPCDSDGAWQIIFNTKILGEISLSLPKTYKSDKDIGKLSIVGDHSKLPKITTNVKQFSGWMGEPSFRPLVLTKNGASNDPDNWRTSKVSPSVRRTVVAAYRRQFPNISNCKNSTENMPITNYKIPDNNLTVTSVFESKSRDFLVQLRPIGYKCDGVLDESWLPQLFFVNRSGSVDYLGDNLTPIDSMDVDKDGSSEWLFWYAGYNEDGYVIFFDRMRKSVRYTWTYH